MKIDGRLTEQKANEWSLVLLAMGIPHKINAQKEDSFIEVPSGFLQQAENQINLYEAEISAVILPEKYIDPVPIPVFTPLILYIFHILVYSSSAHTWINSGAAVSSKMIEGQWWRGITALTLHADICHLLSNIVFGVIAAVSIFRLTGSGLGWFLIITSGFFANMLNALIYKAGHSAIGSSTSVFGALGILTAFQVFRKRKRGWVPVAGAAALLALLGQAPNSDLSGHLFGMICGFVIGVVFILITKKIKNLETFPLPNRDKFQTMFYLINILIPVVSWLTAFNKI